MDIIIGKIFFLISTVWAVIVFYRIAASLLTRRRRDDSAQPPDQQIFSEKPKRVHSR